ncbi:APC family permease [Streptomyces toxytricini]|uniref:APC family permease n=1 Tax=Streptomyces toxytricini TaxID=67369 RepID=A0ABW8EI74_STRT5
MPETGLRRSLGPAAGTAMAVGAVLGPGVLVLPALTVRTAGPAALVAWGSMAVFSLALAVALGRAGARLPQADGIVAYARAAFGPRTTALTGYWLLGSVPLAVPVIALVGAGYVTSYFGADPRWTVALAGAQLFGSCALNTLGMSLSGRVQLVLVALTAAVLTGVSLLATGRMRTENFQPFLPHGWTAVATAGLLIFWSYIGFEMVVHLAEEFRNPQRDLPLSMGLASILLSVVYFLSALVTVGTGVAYRDAGLAPLSALADEALGRAAGGTLAVFALCCSFVAVHSNIAGFSRLMYTQARAGRLPAALGLLHPRRRTPARALAALAAAFALVLAAVAVTGPGLEELVVWPSATFVAVYLVGTLAAAKLLPRGGLGMPAAVLAAAVCLLILPFSWPALLYPAAIAVVGLWATRRGTRGAHDSHG